MAIGNAFTLNGSGGTTPQQGLTNLSSMYKAQPYVAPTTAPTTISTGTGGSSSLLTASPSNPILNTGLLNPTTQTSTPKAATYAAPTTTQAAYGKQGTFTGYTNNPVGISPSPTISNTQTTSPTGVKTFADGSQVDAYGNLIGSVGGKTIQSGIIPTSTQQNAPTAGSTPNTSTPQAPVSSNPSAFQQSVSGLVNAGQNAQNTVNPYTTGLVGTTQQAQDIANKYGQQISDVGLQGAKARAGYLTTGTNPVGEGNAAVLNQSIAAQQQALATGEQAALQGIGYQQSGFNQAGGLATTAQGQGISALGSAASQTAPQAGATFFGSPETGGVVGQGNALISNAVSNAVNQPNLSASDALSQLSAFGPLAQQQYIQAMTQRYPGWSQTNADAISSVNTALAGQYQQQSSNISTNLQGISTVGPQINQLLTQTGINPANIPLINEGIGKYMETNNPAGVASLDKALGEIQTYTSAILGAGGDLTPTDIGRVTSTDALRTLSPKQLQEYLASVDAYGNARLSVFQNATSQTYGSTSGSPAAGYPAGNTTLPSFSTLQNSGLQGVTPETGGQALAGAGISALGNISNLVGSAAKLFGLLK